MRDQLICREEQDLRIRKSNLDIMGQNENMVNEDLGRAYSELERRFTELTLEISRTNEKLDSRTCVGSIDAGALRENYDNEHHLDRCGRDSEFGHQNGKLPYEELKWAYEELKNGISQITNELSKTREELNSKIFAHNETERSLIETRSQLDIRSVKLREAEAALKVLLKSINEDKTEVEENVSFNINQRIMPYIAKLKSRRLSGKEAEYINIIESHLNEITSRFMREVCGKYLKLSPIEMEVADLVKRGMSSKEIAELFHLEISTINFHRHNIRRKLGLTKKKANLRTFLLSNSKNVGSDPILYQQ